MREEFSSPLAPDPTESLEFEPIEGTITDLDGVIRLFPAARDRAIEGRYRFPDGAISQVAFVSSTIELAITGKISDSAWRKNIAERLKGLFPDLDCDSAVRDWSNFPGIADFDVLNELKKLKQLGPLYLMTNATNRLDADLQTLGLFRHFDKIINSSQLGYAKPSFEIYQFALGQLKLPAKKVLFIDDSALNVRTAHGLGFQTHTYKNLSTLKAEVLQRLNPLADSN